MLKDKADAWVLFDGSCGFCSRWVPFWKRLLEAHGIGIAALQDDWVRKRLSLPEEDLVADLRVLESDGTIHRGADAYRFAFRRIPAAGPFQLLAGLPLTRPAFDAAYRAFARNRHRVSAACGLPPRRAR